MGRNTCRNFILVVSMVTLEVSPTKRYSDDETFDSATRLHLELLLEAVKEELSATLLNLRCARYDYRRMALRNREKHDKKTGNRSFKTRGNGGSEFEAPADQTSVIVYVYVAVGCDKIVRLNEVDISQSLPLERSKLSIIPKEMRMQKKISLEKERGRKCCPLSKVIRFDRQAFDIHPSPVIIQPNNS
ncbi:hypothetical protein CEXT_139591 [Caerostris extrusa]|uniref:Uncharacterized protein n=1 Tax=Caerostris extrusa TaxID=172846 RepID=A0AAV4R3G5_CAEEX|nr:hypothetical protein CEXT_139591 [Caerostris extrusa]